MTSACTCTAFRVCIACLPSSKIQVQAGVPKLDGKRIKA